MEEDLVFANGFKNFKDIGSASQNQHFVFSDEPKVAVDVQRRFSYPQFKAGIRYNYLSSALKQSNSDTTLKLANSSCLSSSLLSKIRLTE